MKNIYFSFVLFLVFTHCGNPNSVEISGDPEAIVLAERMLYALGGKKIWAELQSVHVKTVHHDATRDSFVTEVWTNVDEKKIIFVHADLKETEFKVINGNDGWEIKDGQMIMLPTKELYPILRWYKYNFYKNLKRLAVGGEQYELKLNGSMRFDVYETGEYVGGYELGDDDKPLRFFSPGIYRGVKENMIKLSEWQVYDNYPFPKIVTGESAIISNETEVFEASDKTAEKAFQISFNPIELADKY